MMPGFNIFWPYSMTENFAKLVLRNSSLIGEQEELLVFGVTDVGHINISYLGMLLTWFDSLFL